MRWMKRAALAALAVGAFGAVACSSSPSEETGELGNGTFQYPCDTSTVGCDPTNHANVFPTAIASGAKFRVDFQRPDDRADIDSIRPIAKEIIDVSPDGYFTANRPGWGGFYAVNPGSQLVDFSEVRIVMAGNVQLNATPASSFGATTSSNNFESLIIDSSTVDTSTFNLYAGIFSTANEILAGEIQIEWKVGDETIASISNPNGHTATLTGIKAGKTTLTASGAGVTRTANIEVN